MKINDILEQINLLLEEKRKERSIENKGHFVCFTSLKKGYGNSKACEVSISYFHADNGITTIVSLLAKDAIPHNLENAFIENTQKDALKKFFKHILYNFEKYITNDTGAE